MERARQERDERGEAWTTHPARHPVRQLGARHMSARAADGVAPMLHHVRFYDRGLDDLVAPGIAARFPGQVLLARVARLGEVVLGRRHRLRGKEFASVTLVPRLAATLLPARFGL